MAKVKTLEQDPTNYWEQLERLEKLIRASEFKAGVVFSFHSLILGLFADRLDYFQTIFQQSIIFIILISIWIIFVLISIFFCFRCFSPRLELKYEKNVFFFKNAAYSYGDIHEFAARYVETCANENELYTKLAQQIHIESKIIDAKFSSVQKSIRYFALSFLVLLALLIYWVTLI